MKPAERRPAAGSRPGRPAPRPLRSYLANLLLVVLSVAAGCLASEGIARLTIAPRSSGIGMGILDARFRALHRPPGARRAEGEAVSRAGARILMLGDSFTTGQGVDPSEAFPSRAAIALGDAYAVDDLGRDGADTLDEARVLAAALARRGPPLALVVHQYFGNDIDYLTGRPRIPAPRLARPAPARAVQDLLPGRLPVPAAAHALVGLHIS